MIKIIENENVKYTAGTTVHPNNGKSIRFCLKKNIVIDRQYAKFHTLKIQVLIMQHMCIRGDVCVRVVRVVDL